MNRSIFLRTSFTVLILCLASVLGCGGNGSTVSGTVTFNGEPIENGHINFYPADGKGAPVGGEIKNGKYTAKNVTPGKNKVEVISYAKTPGTGSMDDAIKAAKDAKLPADMVAPNDEGNGQTHEIGTGSSELNLTLKTRVSTDGKSR